MVHIILLILKIIGWILLAILGLLVLLLCIVLFIPLRYKLTGKCEGTLESLEGRITFSWLFHLARGVVYYQKGEANWQIWLAWKKLNVPDASKEPAPRPIEKSTQVSVPPMDVTKAEDHVWEALEDKTPSASMPVPVFEDSQPEAPEHSGRLNRFREAINRFYKRIKEFYFHIKYTLCKIYANIKALLGKKDKVAEFISDEKHKAALGMVWKEGLRLLRFLKPKKCKANLHFGFDDPCLTGQALAGLGILFPFIGNHVTIIPDFENQILEGDVMISGHIRSVYLVIILWNLFWDKNVRKTYKDIRKFEF